MSERKNVEAQLVADFAPAMLAKLERARQKGRGGWERPDECTVMHLWDCLHEHVSKSNLDMVDVGNIAAMIWYRLEHNPGEREQLQVHVAQQQPAPASAWRALPGDLVRHKKGGVYRVLMRRLAEAFLYPPETLASGPHTATLTDQVRAGEQIVIYQNIQTKECWARPARLFDQQERFTCISEPPLQAPASAEALREENRKLRAAINRMAWRMDKRAEMHDGNTGEEAQAWCYRNAADIVSDELADAVSPDSEVQP